MVLTVYIHAHMHNPSSNMVYPAFRYGHGKLCHMNFSTSTAVLLKEEEFIDQNRTECTKRLQAA